MARTLVIVDDHEEFRAFARTLLDEGGFDVTGEAADGETAVTEVARLRPDVVLLDVQLPGIDGIEVTHRISALGLDPVMVLTSTRDATAYGARLESSPAAGFIPKQDLSSEALARLVGDD